MIRPSRCHAGWFPALLAFLSLLAFQPAPSAMAGENDLFAGLSDELLVPVNPYLLVNSVTVSNGYRHDHLEPGLGANDFDLYEVGLEAELHLGKLSATGSVDFGWDSGQDAESRDLLGALGYDFDLTVTGIQVTPFAGYSSHHLDRDAHYDAEWEGPFLGARLEIPLAEKWLLQASYFYHWASFEAELAAAAPVRMNRADGSGHTGRLDLIYQVNERVDIQLGSEVQSFASESGSFSGAEADWESWSVKVGVSIKF